MNLDSFENLFVQKLRKLYDAEAQFVQDQPRLAEVAGDEELRVALEAHVEVTKGQIERLVQIGDMLGVTLEVKRVRRPKRFHEETPGCQAPVNKL